MVILSCHVILNITNVVMELNSNYKDFDRELVFRIESLRFSFYPYLNFNLNLVNHLNRMLIIKWQGFTKKSHVSSICTVYF